MRAARLGDDIDDFCIKCKRVMNHSVVSILNDEPAKVRCRTCHSDHDFRHEQAPPPKVDPRKAALFNQVLANIPGAVPVAEDDMDMELEAEAEPEIVEAVELEIEPEPEPEPEAKPKGRKKAKA